ncbi:Sulfotransferase domain-containing protein [Demequina mangrovi]|uniref:Sulfotransferase domain-containing protein n=2 Tax=Demequina mangrovi TaxID=1043493 RepID=A0A1H6YT08_9MICO|nr:Sulfotransferase domain-containing protein [Demequina mangrovi]
MERQRNRFKFSLRRADARRRALPDYLIIGAQKSGTTSLSAYLDQLSDYRPAFRKEVHYFDHNHERSASWYRAHFPRDDRPGSDSWAVGDATPFYLAHPEVPHRAASLIPRARIIAVLRDPVERAYSHFQHSRARGTEPLEDFATALRLEQERTAGAWRSLRNGALRAPAAEHFSYAERGFYARQLKRWYAEFPAEQILVGFSSDLFADPRSFVSAAASHIGRPMRATESVDFAPRNTRVYDGIDETVAAELRALYAEDSVELRTMLGRPLPWAD